MYTCSLGLTSSAQAHPGKLLLAPEGSPALLCAPLVPSSEDWRSCPLLALPQCRAPSGASTTRSKSCISRARDDPKGAGGSYQQIVILIGGSSRCLDSVLLYPPRCPPLTLPRWPGFLLSDCALVGCRMFGIVISNRRVSPSLIVCLSNTYRSSRLSRPCPVSKGSTLLSRTSPWPAVRICYKVMYK